MIEFLVLVALIYLVIVLVAAFSLRRQSRLARERGDADHPIYDE